MWTWVSKGEFQQTATTMGWVLFALSNAIRKCEPLACVPLCGALSRHVGTCPFMVLRGVTDGIYDQRSYGDYRR
jgi:hypothetical protein